MPRASPVDDETVRQRLLSLAVATALAALGAAAASGAPGRLPNWAAPQIATVVAHGLMGATSVRDFQPNAVLTRQALADLASGLEQELAAPPAPLPAPPTAATTTAATTTTTTTTAAATTTAASGGSGSSSSSSPRTSATAGGAGPAPAPGGPPQVSNPDGVVTMAELDRRLVAALGLTRAAQEFAQGARAAGIPVPSRFGSEVVARLLGLRINHPAAQDFLELRPQDPATRAEAAYSAAQILGFGWLGDSLQVASVQQLADTFALPPLDPWQRRILTVAFSKIGMPYVWGGTSDGPEVDFGVPARGGYDCSGFVWRVYKLQRYPNEGRLASTIQGRTTYTMSVEVPRSQRIPFDQLEPADVLFFGTRGPRSTGAQIFHTAIYAGNGWFIQSSGQGVALAQLTGWYRTKFAWARRPLREAGLDS